MTTLSYPVTGLNYDHAQFAKIGSRHHAGVDSGMTLSLSSVSDAATIAVGSLNFCGFQLDVTVAHVLTLAAVGTATTYAVGVMYDPADESDAAGPLTLVGAVKASLVIPTGGAFLTLYEVTRQPSQTLNLATVVNYAAKRASTLTAPTTVTRPPASAEVGPVVWVTSTGTWVSDGSTWQLVNGDSAWVNVSPAAGAVAAAFGPMTSRLTDNGTTRQFRGSVKRSDGGTWAAGTAVRVGSVGLGSPPSAARVWSVVGPSVSVLFELTTSGDVFLTPVGGALSSTRIDGVVPL